MFGRQSCTSNSASFDRAGRFFSRLVCTMDAELHLRMSKKIAQLTKVKHYFGTVRVACFRSILQHQHACTCIPPHRSYIISTIAMRTLNWIYHITSAIWRPLQLTVRNACALLPMRPGKHVRVWNNCGQSCRCAQHIRAVSNVFYGNHS
jgi:hypothetical protein